jgi:hypothetical protein
MTLAEWLQDCPYIARPHGQGGAMVLPDSGVSERKRAQLSTLSDYRVSSVTGGSIWLIPRDSGEK